MTNKTHSNFIFTHFVLAATITSGVNFLTLTVVGKATCASISRSFLPLSIRTAMNAPLQPDEWYLLTCSVPDRFGAPRRYGVAGQTVALCLSQLLPLGAYDIAVTYQGQAVDLTPEQIAGIQYVDYNAIDAVHPNPPEEDDGR